MRWLVLVFSQSGTDKYIVVAFSMSCCTLQCHMADGADNVVDPLALNADTYTTEGMASAPST